MAVAAPVAGVAMLAGAVGLVGLALVVPRRLEPENRRLLLGPAVVAVVALVVTTWGTLVGLNPWMTATNVPTTACFWEAMMVVTYHVMASLVSGVLILFAVRARKARDAGERSQIGFMAAGIIVYMGLVAGIFFMTPLVQTLTIAAGLALGIVCSAGVWLANTRRPEMARQGRNLALLSLGVVLVGMVAGAWLGGFAGARGAGVYGVARTLAILVFVYAILRHQLLGLDVKVRFAIKTSTIAGLFLGVLLIVANVAQNYFGAEYGVIYGGAAAGLLFFALAPIQRAAERFAHKAVPITGSVVAVESAGAAGKEEAYRAALRVALRDRKLTRDEELGLAHLSDELGLTHKRARELWHEVEGGKGAR